ncbi:hypothetical protein [Runella rosea]
MHPHLHCIVPGRGYMQMAKPMCRWKVLVFSQSAKLGARPFPCITDN